MFFQPFFFFPQQCDIQIIFAGGFIHPEIQGIYGEGNLIQLLADKCEIFNLVIGDFPVSGNLDQFAGEWIDFIETGNCLQDNIGEFADFHFRNVALPDGTFMGCLLYTSDAADE